MVCVYTKLGWQRTKGVYKFREDEGRDYIKSGDIGNESWVCNDDQGLINGVKLRYLCRNKLPRIILVLMHGDDYVINGSSIRPGVWR